MPEPWEDDPKDDEIDWLRRQLKDYGGHQEGCSAQFGITYRCRCGWREIYPVLYGREEGSPDPSAVSPENPFGTMTAVQLMALHFPHPWEEQDNG